VTGPGYANVDLSVVKSVEMRGSRTLEIRGEAFNILNHTNFDLPNRFFGSANFGRIFGAGTSRQVQLGMKYLF